MESMISQKIIESEMEELSKSYLDKDRKKVIELSKKHNLRDDLRYYVEGKLWYSEAPDSVRGQYPTEYINALKSFIDAIKNGYKGEIFLDIFTVACNLGAGTESTIFSNRTKILYIQLAFQSGALAMRKGEEFADREVPFKLQLFSGREYSSEGKLLGEYLKEVHNLSVKISTDAINEWRYEDLLEFLNKFKEIEEGFLRF